MNTLSQSDLEEKIYAAIEGKVRNTDVPRIINTCSKFYHAKQAALTQYEKKKRELHEQAKVISSRGDVAIFVPPGESEIGFFSGAQAFGLHLPNHRKWLSLGYGIISSSICPGISIDYAQMRSADKTLVKLYHSPSFTIKNGKFHLSTDTLEQTFGIKDPDNWDPEDSKDHKGTFWTKMLCDLNIRQYKKFASNALMGTAQLNERETALLDKFCQRYETHQESWSKSALEGSKKGEEYKDYAQKFIIPIHLIFTRLYDSLFVDVHQQASARGLDYKWIKGLFTLETIDTSCSDLKEVYHQHEKSIESDVFADY